MASKEYAALLEAISDLKTELLGFSQRTDGDYTHEELMKCQAFIVFSHAEIENYLEKIARRIISEAANRWNESSLPDRVITTLVTFRRKEICGPPNDIKNPLKHQNIKVIVEDALKSQEQVIAENNGIKQANLSQLICPLGVFEYDIDDTLLIQLDIVGAKRGGLVHKQNKVSLRTIRDPFSVEWKDVNDLLNQLQSFDKNLENLSLISLPSDVRA
jgi:hypothetical protein